MARIVAGLTREAEGRRVPVILFTKGGGQWLGAMARSGCDALGVDWTTDLADARWAVGDRVALQGNLDPCVLYASPERIRAEVARAGELRPGAGMSSTWATASIPMWSRTMRRPWWTPCMR